MAYAALMTVSRVAGLGREVMAASYFGVSGAMSAFTIAFQVPNLVRSLVADVALEGGLIPVLTEMLERGRRREVVELLVSLMLVIAIGLGVLTAVAVLLAPLYLPLVAPGLPSPLTSLAVGLAQVMLPIVPLLSLGAVLTGTLYSHERFLVPALGPVLWNVVVMAAFILFVPLFTGAERLYAYAIGVLVATIAQVALPVPWVRRLDLGWRSGINIRSPEVRRVLSLMLPVTVAWGSTNFMLLVDSIAGTLVGPSIPAAIDKAFRIFQLPQGIFAVAASAILFTAFARAAARDDIDDLRRTAADGIRYLAMFLIPAAIALAVFSHPIVTLVYQRGAFDASDTDLVATALTLWAVSLPFSGVSLVLARVFFAIGRPWDVARLTLIALGVNIVLAGLLYRPFDMPGIIAATALSSILITVMQLWQLRRHLAPWLFRDTGTAVARMAASGLVFGVAAHWSYVLLPWQGQSAMASLGATAVALAIASPLYLLSLVTMRGREPHELRTLIRRSAARAE